MSVLDSIERESRKEAKSLARRFSETPRWYPLLLSAGVTPFLVLVTLFVPLVGQLLSISALVLTIYFLWLKRSLRLVFEILAGWTALALLLPVISFLSFGGEAFFTYLFMGFSMFVSIAYIVLLVGAIYLHYEVGFERISDRSAQQG
jgi:predicted membrane channel-forming protein YqfA (hemolysin III family)